MPKQIRPPKRQRAAPAHPSLPVQVVLPAQAVLPVQAVQAVLPVLTVKRTLPVTWLAGILVVLVGVVLFLPSSIRSVFWLSLQSQPIAVTLLLVFILVAISLVWSAGQKLDAWVFLRFNLRGTRPYWLDMVMLGLTQLGNGFATLALAVIVFLAGQRLLAYELLLGTLTLWLIVMGVKAIVRRSRPFIRLVQTRIIGFRATGRSFPSGHTSQSFFVATVLVQHFHVNVIAAVLIYAVALLVGITRMYVGAHYPRDVLAGAILGSAWGLLGWIVESYVLNGIGIGG